MNWFDDCPDFLKCISNVRRKSQQKKTPSAFLLTSPAFQFDGWFVFQRLFFVDMEWYTGPREHFGNSAQLISLKKQWPGNSSPCDVNFHRTKNTQNQQSSCLTKWYEFLWFSQTFLFLGDFAEDFFVASFGAGNFWENPGRWTPRKLQQDPLDRPLNLRYLNNSIATCERLEH